MNERIRELMMQSWNTYYNEEVNGARFAVVQKFDAERFAELIVRECVQTLKDNTPERFTNEAAEEDWDKGYDRAMRDCVLHIKQHFGVEE